MGLFNFARDIGKHLFGKEAEASDKIKEEIEHNNPGIRDLKVDYHDGVVSLSGHADSAEAMEKAVLMAGNVKGVGEVKADQLQAPAQTAPVEYYEIAAGDTLSGIAKRYLGDANAWQQLFDANREVIKDPNLIFPGQKIRVPLSTTR